MHRESVLVIIAFPFEVILFCWASETFMMGKNYLKISFLYKKIDKF